MSYVQGVVGFVSFCAGATVLKMQVIYIRGHAAAAPFSSRTIIIIASGLIMSPLLTVR